MVKPTNPKRSKDKAPQPMSPLQCSNKWSTVSPQQHMMHQSTKLKPLFCKLSPIRILSQAVVHSKKETRRRCLDLSYVQASICLLCEWSDMIDFYLLYDVMILPPLNSWSVELATAFQVNFSPKKRSRFGLGAKVRF